MTSDQIMQLLVIALLGAILLALVYIAWTLKRVFMPTVKQRLRIVRDRTAFNSRLLADKHLLARFAYSEAGIDTRLQDLAEEKVEMDDDARDIVKDSNRWGRIKDWVRKHSGTLVEKINDIAKSAIGLGGK